MGIIINCGTIVLGTLIGLLLRHGIKERFAQILSNGLGLCVLYIGISGVLKGENQLIAIISVAIGALIGEALKLDDRLNLFADKLQKKFAKSSTNSNFAKGFSSATLLFCIGAMAVVGSINSGLTGDNSTLYAKSILDGVSSVIFASTLGAGVMLSAVSVFLYQGIIFLAAGFAAPYLTGSVNEMTCVGSILIIAIGLNMLKITNIKVMNYIPAVFIPIILCMFM